MAGFLPGIFICLVLCVVAHFLCKKQGFEPSERAATEEKVQAFKDAILALLMPGDHFLSSLKQIQNLQGSEKQQPLEVPWMQWNL